MEKLTSLILLFLFFMADRFDWKWHGVHSHKIIHAYQAASIAPPRALKPGDRYAVYFYDRIHIRIEDDMGSLFARFPKTMLLPNNKCCGNTRLMPWWTISRLALINESGSSRIY
ncbi:hypothetical protein ACFLT1_10075 [Bacteroidota bacterium]